MTQPTVNSLAAAAGSDLNKALEKAHTNRVPGMTIGKGFVAAFTKAISDSMKGVNKSLVTESGMSTASTIAPLNFDPAVKHVYPVQTPWLNGGLIGEVGGQNGFDRTYWMITDPNQAMASGAAPQMSAEYTPNSTTGTGYGAFLKQTSVKRTLAFGKLMPMGYVTDEEARLSGPLNAFVQKEMSSLAAAKIIEEQNMLFSYNGALTRTTAVTGTAGTAGALSNGTYIVSVSALNYWGYQLLRKNADANTITALIANARNGETDVRASANVVLAAGTTTQSIAATWPKVTGAFAYAVYLTLAGTQYLVGIVGHNSFVATNLTISGFTISGAAIAPTADASALDNQGQSVIYKGYFQQCLDTDVPAEYLDVAAQGLTAVAGGTGVSELDTILETLFRKRGVSPDSLTIASQDWRGWQSALMNTASTNYRLTVETEEGTKVSAGQVINTIKNPYSGEVLDVIVHPLMPPGKAFLYTRDLPYQANNTGVNLSHYYNVRYLQEFYARTADFAPPGPWGTKTIGIPILTYPSACGLLENIRFGDTF